MLRSLSRLFLWSGASSHSPARKSQWQAVHFKPRLEALEGRVVPTITIIGSNSTVPNWNGLTMLQASGPWQSGTNGGYSILKGTTDYGTFVAAGAPFSLTLTVTASDSQFSLDVGSANLSGLTVLSDGFDDTNAENTESNVTTGTITIGGTVGAAVPGQVPIIGLMATSNSSNDGVLFHVTLDVTNGTPPPPSPPVLTVTPDTTTFKPAFSWTAPSATSSAVTYSFSVVNTVTGKAALNLPTFQGTSLTAPVTLQPGTYQAVVVAHVGTSSLTSQPTYFQAGIQATFNDGVLTIVGTSGPDSIFVGQTKGQISITGATSGQTANQAVQILDGAAPPVSSLSAADVQSITVNGNGGGDDILLNQGTQAIQGAAVINEPPNNLTGAGGAFVAGIRGGSTTYNNCSFVATDWAPNGPLTSDVSQGNIGNCGFVACLAAVTLTGADLNLTGVTNLGNGANPAHSRVKYLGDDGNPADAFKFTVDLYNTYGVLTPIPVEFKGSLTNDDPFPFVGFGKIQPPSPGPYQFWTVLYERAFVNMTGDSGVGADPTVALPPLTGRAVVKIKPILGLLRTVSGLFTQIQDELNTGGNVVAGTGPLFTNNPNLVTSHAYTVVSVSDVAGVPSSVTLRNPWGTLNTSQQPDDTGGIVTVSWEYFLEDFAQVYLSGPTQERPPAPPPTPRPLPLPLPPVGHANAVEAAFSGFGSAFGNIFH